MKKLALLGATGSIGTQVLEIVKNNPDYRIKSIAFGNNVVLGRKIIEEFQPEFVAVRNDTIKEDIFRQFPQLKIGVGEAGLIEAATFVAPGD